ncbi:VOC family protein [Paenibacillus macerans]|uniref:VOC family protein n=1 Tax=Paenibacillus macerans TaxID=44252 RepID=UPI00203BB5FF|nr:VOC family protein [Paenibacillus macerans]MCM3701254.1 VOC family protein [Paenibacillus macerans]
MMLKWDHTVQYVNDLDTPVAAFAKWGLAAFKGGSHKFWGTYNALSYFGLTYIEFLGIEDRELAEKIDSPNAVVRDALSELPARQAFSRVALRTDDIDRLASRLQGQGLELSPILDGRRLDAQGNWIEWRMFTIDGHYRGLSYPFILQWSGADEERLSGLKATGVIKDHPAGEVNIQSAVFTVSDPAAAAAHWRELFGLPLLEAAPGGETAELGIGDKSFLFKQGGAERLTQLVFKTNAPDLQNKTLEIGEAQFVFLPE